MNSTNPPLERADFPSRGESSNSLEALVVTNGRIEIAIDGGETRTVTAGQALIFAAHMCHEYRSVADRAAEFHLAVFDPIDSPGGR
jgi:quercetin dioxygenase-like cupin family protein